MLRDTASGLVGLIVIEILDDGQDGQPMPDNGHDATLGQFLVYLARRGATVETVADVEVPPAGQAGRRRSRPSRLSADTKGLATQLERALAATRRRLKRSLQASA